MSESTERDEVRRLADALAAHPELTVSVDRPDLVRVHLLLGLAEDIDNVQLFTADDPHALIVTFVNGDDGLWTVATATPPLLSLGTVGHVRTPADGPDITFANEEGSAFIELVHHGVTITEPVEALDEAIGWYIWLADEFASTGLAFARRERELTDPFPTTPGFLQLHEASDHLDGSDPDVLTDQARALEVAVQLFTIAGIDEYRLRALGVRSLNEVLQGRAKEALQTIQTTIDAYRRLGMNRADLERQLVSIEGLIQATFFGRREAADAAFVRAEQLGSDEQLQGLLSLSRTGYAPRTSRVRAQSEAKILASRRTGDAGSLIEAGVSKAFHHKRLSQFDEARELLESALELAERHEPTSVFSILFDLCGVQVALGDRDSANATYQRMKTMEAPHGVMGGHQSIAVGLIGFVLGDDDATSLLQNAPDLDLGLFSELAEIAVATKRSPTGGDPFAQLDRMLALVDSTGDPMMRAVIYTELAKARLGRIQPNADIDAVGEIEQAMEDVLTGIRSHDRARHQLEGVQDRALYQAQILVSYELALSIACDQRRFDLVAELLERLRSLGLPDGSPERDNALLPVREPTHTSIDGVSVLAPEGAETEELADRIARQAGPEAWWWSVWQGSRYVIWATRAPGGRLAARAIALDPDPMREALTRQVGPAARLATRHLNREPLQPHIDALRDDLPIGGRRSSRRPGAEAEEDDGRKGRLGRTYATDGLATLGALGDLLIPYTIRAALSEAERDRPIRVLYNLGPSLTWLPAGLLVIPGRSDGLHVIDRAVLQVMAPTEPTRRRPADGRGTMAIVDPSDEHRHMWPLADGAASVIAGPGLHAELGPDRSREANKQTILAELAVGDRHELLVYAGHAVSGSADRPLHGGIRLGVGNVLLSVAELLEAAPDLHPPRKAVLCACSTMTDVEARTAERWGLPAALLLAGCEQLVATGWDVRSCAATAGLIRALIESQSEDLAVSLRAAQLDRLDRWRADVAAGRLGVDLDDQHHAHPFLWATFVAMGRRPAQG